MAQDFTLHLSGVYRRLLDWRNRNVVTLREELSALADYEHLLHVRFEDRLRVVIDIDEGLLDQYVVPFALQTLLENAVKHNEASLARPLEVRITGEAAGVRVTNTIQARSSRREASTGLGLQNLRERYALLTDTPLSIASDAENFAVYVPVIDLAPAPILKKSTA